MVLPCYSLNSSSTTFCVPNLVVPIRNWGHLSLDAAQLIFSYSFSVSFSRFQVGDLLAINFDSVCSSQVYNLHYILIHPFHLHHSVVGQFRPAHTRGVGHIIRWIISRLISTGQIQWLESNWEERFSWPLSCFGWPRCWVCFVGELRHCGRYSRFRKSTLSRPSTVLYNDENGGRDCETKNFHKDFQFNSSFSTRFLSLHSDAHFPPSTPHHLSHI